MESRFIKKEDARLGEDQLLIKWLREERRDLVAQINPSPSKRYADILQKWVLPAAKVLLFSVCANPKEFDGNAYVTQESERHAALTSKVVSGATLLNAITNWPILFYAFRFVGALPALTLSTALNLIVLWWTNQTGTTAASRKHGNSVWSGAGVMAFLAMSMVQSVVAGVGSELINNQEGLSYIKAEELVDEHVVRLEGIHGDLVKKQSAAKELCFEAEALLDSNNPDFNRQYYQVYGATFVDRQAGTYPNPKAPCAPMERERYDDRVYEAEQAIEQAEDERLATNNDIVFLRTIRDRGGAQTYSQYFEEKMVDGRSMYVLRSGTDAMKIASENFWNALTGAEAAVKAQQGAKTSIFFFWLSMITSLSASFLITTHSFKKETQMSHSANIKAAVIWWLESMRQQYAQRIGYENTDNDEQLLNLFIRDYRTTGKCDYPKVQAIINMSQAGVDLRLIGDGAKLLDDAEVAYKKVDVAASSLYDYLDSLRCQATTRRQNLRGMIEETADYIWGDSVVNSQEMLVSKKDSVSVKDYLSDLRQGVTGLISLSNRYAAGVSLDGNKKYSKKIRGLEEDLEEKMKAVRTSPYAALSKNEMHPSEQNKALSDLQSQLIQIQGDCSELKEIAQEEIKNKLIPLFVEGQFESVS